MVIYPFLKPFLSAAKIPLDLQVVHIFFDSSTFDKVEKDAKVKIIIIIDYFGFPSFIQIQTQLTLELSRAETH